MRAARDRLVGKIERGSASPMRGIAVEHCRLGDETHQYVMKCLAVLLRLGGTRKNSAPL